MATPRITMAEILATMQYYTAPLSTLINGRFANNAISFIGTIRLLMTLRAQRRDDRRQGAPTPLEMVASFARRSLTRMAISRSPTSRLHRAARPCRPRAIMQFCRFTNAGSHSAARRHIIIKANHICSALATLSPEDVAGVVHRAGFDGHIC